MSAYDFLRLAQGLGVKVYTANVEGAPKLRLAGSEEGRAQLRPHVSPAMKAALLDLFSLTRYDRPADAPSEQWERNSFGVLVNLDGLRGTHGPN